MSTNSNYFEHLLHIYKNLYESRMLPFEKRVKPIKNLISYFNKNLSDELSHGTKEALEAQKLLYEELSEAAHLESSYKMLYVAFSKARDQLRHDPSCFEGFGDLLEQIAGKASEEIIVHRLCDDEISIDMIVRLYLAEHYAILHPEEAKKFSRLTDQFQI